MKLTNFHRETFVRQVMGDVPCIDWDAKIRDYAMAAIVEALLPLIQRAWKDKEARRFVNLEHVHFAGISMKVPYTSEWDYGREPRMSEDAKKHVDEMAAAAKEQSTQRERLEQRLSSVARACTTRKALAEALPEFAKYLPAETETIRSVPAVANVVADFVAAGWPKDKKAA